MELSGSKIKKFLIFSQKTTFLLLQEIETQKQFCIFEQMELSHISANRNLKNF